MVRNRYDRTGTCFVNGSQAEDAFKKVLINRGVKFREATTEEQRKQHIDFVVQDGEKTIKYEVKSRKRVGRNDSSYNDDVTWLEFNSVGGHPGWLFGAADFIAFEREDHFIIIEREKLASFAQTKCDMETLVPYSSMAIYKGYSRRDRNDLVTLVPTADIMHLVCEKMLKA